MSRPFKALAGLITLALSACPSSSPPGFGNLDSVPWHEVEVWPVDAADTMADVAHDLGTPICLTDEDCPGGLHCDPRSHTCVQCLEDTHCPEGTRCVNYVCEQAPTCDEQHLCAPPLVCDPETNTCVECLTDEDCMQGQKCRNKVCVECFDSSQCEEDFYCDPVLGKCLKDLCTPGFRECVGNVSVQCREDGSGWDVAEICATGWSCEKGECVQACTPNCIGTNGRQKQCGPDGCGGECGQCEPGQQCIEGFCETVCIPSCAGKECGDNGCGGVCGVCSQDFWCIEGKCVGGQSCAEGLDCILSCTDPAVAAKCLEACKAPLLPEEQEVLDALISCLQMHCKQSPPGSPCWHDALEKQCKNLRDACVACTPSCAGKQCGPDGCGGECGVCPASYYCEDHICKPLCVPQCAGKVCGPDGCGGQCGVCPEGTTCENGLCTCVPKCTGKQCGPDGCGGLCGTCPAGYECSAGQCVCKPQCAGKECGPDGCGGLCGTCPQGYACSNGKCVCVPKCAGKQCGPDGCGGSCGTCPQGQTCDPSGKCIACTPSCQGKECGPDGCGGTCGTCAQGYACQNGKCVCVPQCVGKECGDDGCGGSCGSCAVGFYCVQGRCQQECMPNCIGKPCGPDGCGGSCGTCPAGYYCSASQQCLPSCIPSCVGKECGPDGCGGQCGGCGPDEYCSKDGKCLDFWSCYDILVCTWGCAPNDEVCTYNCFQQGSPAAQKQWIELWKCLFEQCGSAPPQSPCWSQALAGACKSLYYQCLDCTPNCIGKQCGPDGCGGSCGTCPNNAPCDPYGQCPCAPNCTGKECGPDGCGGLCGTCGPGLVCNASGRCVCLPKCDGKECGPDGCGGTCGKCPDNWQCVLGKCQAPCVPQCAGKQCGPDGCGGVCGICPSGQICLEDQGLCVSSSDGCVPSPLPGCGGCPCEKCVCSLDPYCCEQAWDELCVQECIQCKGCGGCIPNCTNPDGTVKMCGPDGCGGQCGYCPPGLVCNALGQCVQGGVFLTCEQGIQCVFACSATFDWCLQACGEQVQPQQRNAFYGLMKCAYQFCATPWGTLDPDCFYKVAKAQCVDFYQQCVAVCIPNCVGKQCGPDGCGGSCGTCPKGYTCNSQGQCVPQQKGCGDALQCMLSCGGLSWTCIQGCISGLPPTSQQLLMQLAGCVIQACGMNPSTQCIMNALQGTCYDEFMACLADGGGIIIF